MPKRGRPRLDEFDRMELEGRYLWARGELNRLLGRPPTNEEIADLMGYSTRTVVMIRGRMRDWRRETFAALGMDPPGTDIDFLQDTMHALATSPTDEDLILSMYRDGKMSTSEAADRLARDERALRRWRSLARKKPD